MSDSRLLHCSYGLFVISVALRFAWIDAPLSSDELANASIWAQMPISKIVSNYQYPNNHIFLTLILAVVLKIFGVDDIALRLPVLICGVLSIYIAYINTLRITRNLPIALGTSFLLAISAQHIYYSTNARGYMILMVFSQIVLHRALAWSQEPDPKVTLRDLVCLGVLCFLGTWTVPTFVLFEVSLGLYFGLLVHFKLRSGNIARAHIQILLTLVLCLSGFYIQYYVLIPGDMLKMGIANSMSESNKLSGLIPAILYEWVHPCENLLPALVIIAIWGMSLIYKLDRPAFYLLICAIVVPPLATIILCAANIMAVVPHARVFIYLQPIFFTALAVGVYFIAEKAVCIYSSHQNANWFFAFMLLPFAIISFDELGNRVYPERQNREPFHKVLRFIKNLGPLDLVIASSKPHVGFYLYGAEEMRKRVENIIDKQELGDIYFLAYTHNKVSDMQKVNDSGMDYFKFTDHIDVASQNGQRKDLLIPAEMFELSVQYDNFEIYKIKRQYLQTLGKLKTPADMQGWEGTYRLEPHMTPTGTQPAIRFDDSVKLVSRKRVGESDDLFSLSINLLSTTLSGNNGAFYLNVEEKQSPFTGSWLANAWTMDHPYGSTIFNRPWHPAIFISESKGSLETIITQQAGQGGIIRGIQSYRLAIAKFGVR